MNVPTELIVVEYGSQLPPRRSPVGCADGSAASEGAMQVVVTVAQQPQEGMLEFSQRVLRRCRRLVQTNHEVRLVTVAFSARSSQLLLCQRLSLVRNMVALLELDRAELVLAGQLTRTYDGALDFWALVETLIGQLSGMNVLLRALPQPLPLSARSVRATEQDATADAA